MSQTKEDSCTHKLVEKLTLKEYFIRGFGGERNTMPIFCKLCGKKFKTVYVEVTNV